MRKKHSTTVKLLCTCLTFLLVFTGCTVNPESIEMMDSTNYNPKEDNVVSEIPARYDLLDHIEMSFDENHFVDADVYAPQSTMVTNYILEPLEITLETGASIFFPDDNSSSSIETIDGISILKTEQGNRFSTQRGIISYYKEGQAGEEYGEIENLLWRYSQNAPQDHGTDLDFMTRDDAVELGIDILKKLGICFDPVLESCVAMDHQQLMDYQQHLFVSDEYYDEFGKVYTLQGLNEDHDSYLCTYNFSYQSVPVYGYEGEPPIQFVESIFPPYASSATILITRQGVTVFRLIGAYTVSDQEEPVQIIPVEQIIEAYKEKTDLVILSEKRRVGCIFLEYIPVVRDYGMVLTPYWCISIDYEAKSYLDGQPTWARSVMGERFNALTGEDMTYGG